VGKGKGTAQTDCADRVIVCGVPGTGKLAPIVKDTPTFRVQFKLGARRHSGNGSEPFASEKRTFDPFPECMSFSCPQREVHPTFTQFDVILQS
jgi:hypothetical protein